MRARTTTRAFLAGTVLLAAVLGPLAGAGAWHTSPQPTPAVTSRETVLRSFGPAWAGPGEGGVSGATPDATGRRVVMETADPTLFDDGRPAGLVVRDRTTGTLARVAVSADGSRDDPAATGGGISGDGRYVVFASEVDLTAAGAPAGVPQVYVRDLSLGTTRLVSRAVDAGPARLGCTSPRISRDGRRATCLSASDDLVAGDTNGRVDVFLLDLAGGPAVRASLGVDGAQRTQDSLSAVPSGDGSSVVFAAHVLSSSGTSLSRELYRFERSTGRVTVVAVRPDGTPARADAAAVSDDGTRVAFESSQALVPGVSGRFTKVYVRDLVQGTTRLASAGPSGREADADAGSPSISGDGRLVAFHSTASNLTPLAEQFGTEVFVHEVAAGVTTRASSGGDGQASSVSPVLTGDGRALVHRSVVGTDQVVRLAGLDLALSAEGPASVFVPVAPTRVLTGERLPQQGPLPSGLSYHRLHVDLRARGVQVPAGATALAANLTVSGTTSRTFVSVCAPTQPYASCVATSTVNTDAGADAANFATVRLYPSTDGRLGAFDLFSPLAGLVSLDVTGYFVDARTTGTAGATSVDLVQPTRLAQTVRVPQGGSALVTVPGAPVGASGVVLRTTVAGVTGRTYVSVCPSSQDVLACRRTSTLNTVPGRDTSNMTVLPLGADRRVRVYNDRGSVTALFDVAGWLVPRSQGSLFVPVHPVRYASRLTPLTEIALPSLPPGTTGVATNLTASAVKESTYVSACPSTVMTDAQCLTTSVVNAYRGEDRAASTWVRTSDDPVSSAPPGPTFFITNLRGDYQPGFPRVVVLSDITGYLVDPTP